MDASLPVLTRNPASHARFRFAQLLDAVSSLENRLHPRLLLHDPNTANWLPAISRSLPSRRRAHPRVYHGEVGTGLRPETPTEVWCLVGK